MRHEPMHHLSHTSQAREYDDVLRVQVIKTLPCVRESIRKGIGYEHAVLFETLRGTGKKWSTTTSPGEAQGERSKERDREVPHPPTEPGEVGERTVLIRSVDKRGDIAGTRGRGASASCNRRKGTV
jgi:hypothetical protein